MIPKFICMIGLPASGKSIKAQELASEYNATIFSSDALRKELYDDESMQGDNTKLFNTLHQQIKTHLKNGYSAILDSTNLSYKRRMAFLSELKRIPCEKICVLMATPYEECLKRNAERERKVPVDVIERMYRSFDVPYWYEGWDDIKIVIHDIAKYPINCINELMTYDQKNSHHTLTLGQHLLQTLLCVQNDISNDYRGEKIRIAAALHDCAKPICATFNEVEEWRPSSIYSDLEVSNIGRVRVTHRIINNKSYIDENRVFNPNAVVKPILPDLNCHYYNHEKVSAYESLFFRSLVNPLDYAIIIRWHMQPYFWEKDNNEKLQNKYRKLWGEELYQDVMILHAADKEAH